MRSILSVALTLVLLARMTPAEGSTGIAAQIASLPTHASVEVQTNDKKKLRGVLDAVSDSGFTLIDAQSTPHQLTFSEVRSVKRLPRHTTRNVWIIVGACFVGLLWFAA
jgi:hypothetical protein